MAEPGNIIYPGALAKKASDPQLNIHQVISPRKAKRCPQPTDAQAHPINLSPLPPPISLPIQEPQRQVPHIKDKHWREGYTTSFMLDNYSVVDHHRTYQSYRQGAYALPNDSQEQDRLDLQHETIRRHMNDRLYYAPIEDPKTVLDIGTGTGIWAIRFAEEHPRCHVVGTDLSLIQPAKRPPNTIFIRHDAENDTWNFPCTFDFIHLRLMFVCFFDFTTILQGIWDNLTPGCWVEFQDHTPEVFAPSGEPIHSAVSEWCRQFTKGLYAMGHDPMRMKYLRVRLEEFGFTCVHQIVQPYLVGGWHPDNLLNNAGYIGKFNIFHGVDSTIRMLRASGMTEQQIHHMMYQVKDEIAERQVAQYGNFYIIWARKPA